MEHLLVLLLLFVFQVITQLNLLPLDDETVDQKLASFRNYDDEVTSHFDILLLSWLAVCILCMTIICSFHLTTKLFTASFYSFISTSYTLPKLWKFLCLTAEKFLSLNYL